jgi:hypothetical protein
MSLFFIVVPLTAAARVLAHRYVAQADPKGWLPAWVANIVSESQAYNPGEASRPTRVAVARYALTRFDADRQGWCELRFTS